MQTCELVCAFDQVHFRTAGLVEFRTAIRAQDMVGGPKIMGESLAVGAVTDDMVAIGLARLGQFAGYFSASASEGQFSVHT
jgi:hypothetical protein